MLKTAFIRHTTLLFGLVVLIFSCEQIGPELPAVPQRDSVDLNQDGQYDLEINYTKEYQKTGDQPHAVIHGNIRPMYDSEIFLDSTGQGVFNDQSLPDHNQLLPSGFAIPVNALHEQGRSWSKQWEPADKSHQSGYIYIRSSKDTTTHRFLLQWGAESGKIELAKIN